MGHWYDRNGTPRHYIGEGATQRDSTLADARKLGWVPGFSGVNSVIHEFFLEKWKRDQNILAALTLTRNPNESDKDFLYRVDQDAKAQMDKAADEGKRIHAAIEDSFAGRAIPADYRKHVSAVHGLLKDNFPEVNDWEIEQTFACPDGYGGAIDIHSKRHRILGDHKGVEVAPEEKKQLARRQYRQLGCYRHGIGLHGARGFNIFISRNHPGHVRFHEWQPAELDKGWREFSKALALWKELNNYESGWTRDSDG